MVAVLSQIRRIAISYLYSFRFSWFALILHVILVTLLIFWFLYQLKKDKKKVNKKQQILLSLVGSFPLIYLLLCWLNKGQPEYYNKANLFSPSFRIRHLLFFVVLSLFVVLSFGTAVFMITETSLIKSLNRNVGTALVSLFIWSILVAIIVMNTLNFFHMKGFDVFYFFYGLRSSKFSQKQIKEKINWYLCGDINRQFLDSHKIESRDAIEFLRQWNLTFKNKLTPEKFNRMVSRKKCPYGSPRDGKPFPIMDTGKI